MNTNEKHVVIKFFYLSFINYVLLFFQMPKYACLFLCLRKSMRGVIYIKDHVFTKVEILRSHFGLQIIKKTLQIKFTFHFKKIQFWTDSKIVLSWFNKMVPLNTKSYILPLKPFLNEFGVIRLNGRLSQSSLSYTESYSIILPRQSRFTQLLLQFIHVFPSTEEN